MICYFGEAASLEWVLRWFLMHEFIWSYPFRSQALIHHVSSARSAIIEYRTTDAPRSFNRRVSDFGPYQAPVRLEALRKSKKSRFLIFCKNDLIASIICFFASHLARVSDESLLFSPSLFVLRRNA